MSWTQISLGHWQRPLGANERMIKWIGDRAHSARREHWSVTASASFKVPGSLTGQDLPPILREAWIILRSQHPGISTQASTEDTLDYTVLDAAGLEEWADKTFIVVSDPDVPMGDVIASLEPSAYTTCHFLPHASEFALHTAHWRTDGYGILQLVDAFCECICRVVGAANRPREDEQAPRLPPSVEEALSLPGEPSPEAMEAAKALLATGRHIAGSIGLKDPKDALPVPQGTRSVRLSLPEAVSKSILSAAKARGLQLVSVVHASLAAANFTLSFEPGHYTSTIRLGLRPHLKPPFNSSQYAAALYTGSYMAKMEAGASWSDMASQYEAMYSRGATPDFLRSRKQFAISALQMMQSAGQAAPARSEVDISTVGDAGELVTASHHGENGQPLVQVTDISVGVECLTPESYLFFWIFRGCLEFNVVYNEAFHAEERMRELLNVLQTELETELRVRQ